MTLFPSSVKTVPNLMYIIIKSQFVPDREHGLIPLERKTSNCLPRDDSMQSSQCEIRPCTQTDEWSLKGVKFRYLFMKP